jgi:uncharacterized protein (TIGR02466 family)
LRFEDSNKEIVREVAMGMTEDPEVIRLFPSYVAKVRAPDPLRDSIGQGVLATVEDLRAGQPDVAAGEVWQSPHGLHRLAAMQPLVAYAAEVAGPVLEFLSISSRALSFTGCWINLAAPGAEVKMHAHPNNFLSGVYYVQVQPGADTLNFHDPRPQTGIIRPPVTELTAYNTDQVVVPVEVGALVLFPAWLPHSVSANRSDRLRISVSFNLMFDAFAETMGAPLWGEG